METNKSLVTLLSTLINYDKQGVKQISDAIIEEFRAGNVSETDFIGQLEFLIQSFTAASDTIRAEITETLLRSYGETEARKGIKNRLGHEIKVAEMGTKYDYSNTPRWVEINTRLQEVKVQLTELEMQLKVLKSPQQLFDGETGELIDMNPPIKSSKTGIKITIPKTV